MSKGKSNRNVDEQKNDEIYLTKKQFYLGLIGFIFSVIFSIYSIYISSEENFIAREANNMSLMTLSHKKIIEEANWNSTICEFLCGW